MGEDAADSIFYSPNVTLQTLVVRAWHTRQVQSRLSNLSFPADFSRDLVGRNCSLHTVDWMKYLSMLEHRRRSSWHTCLPVAVWLIFDQIRSWMKVSSGFSCGERARLLARPAETLVFKTQLSIGVSNLANPSGPEVKRGLITAHSFNSRG